MCLLIMVLHAHPRYKLKYLARLSARADSYNGLNLVVGCNDQYYRRPRVFQPHKENICV